MNTFARTESVCTFKDGLSFLIKSISLIAQSIGLTSQKNAIGLRQYSSVKLKNPGHLFNLAVKQFVEKGAMMTPKRRLSMQIFACLRNWHCHCFCSCNIDWCRRSHCNGHYHCQCHLCQHFLTCTTSWMIEGVVTSTCAGVQIKEALVFECGRIGRTNRLLIRRTAVVA